jgi:hypothetical protein
MDKQLQTSNSSSSSGLMAISILFANLDFTGFYDCALKAAIGGIVGGAIWIGTQALNEYRKERKEARKVSK